MDAFLAHQRLIAAATRTSQPIAARCHRYISRRPMVICCYHLAGDPGAPLGFLYGSDINSPKVVVVGEPRNRDLRFRGLEHLAHDFNNYINNFRSRSVVLDRHGRPKRTRDGDERTLADDAPQLVVPNAATADWMGMLARSVVWLRTDGDFEVDAALPRFGAHLTHLTGRRAVAGSANILAATELLELHWTSGQTDYEDANLATLLSWVDPNWMDPAWFESWVPPVDGCDAATYAETLPSQGPVSDPRWDMHTLGPIVAAFNADRKAGRATEPALALLREAVVDALRPAWVATWRAICLVSGLPEGATVPNRWESDRWAWTSHLSREDEGRTFFRRHRSAIAAASLISTSEEAVAEVKASMAFDDPLVMARYIVAGEAIQGCIVDRDDTHSELGPSGRRRVTRPIVEVAPADEVLQPVGTKVVWASDTRVRGEIYRLPVAADDRLVIVITNGMRTGAMPRPGESGCFTTLAPAIRYPQTLPDAVPWTHALPTPPDDGNEAA